MILSVLITGTAGILLFRIRFRQIRDEEKKKADIRLELNSLEMKALKAQMNPHFIFNAINSIQSYILTNDTDQALYYLSLFSRLVRRTLENASREAITLSEEIEYLNFYVELEKMRFGDNIEYDLQVDPVIQAEMTMIPPMIVQPFVENAIKHGLMNRTGKSRLTISVRKSDASHFTVVVEDNGVGRKKAEEIKRLKSITHQSRGMEMTLTRIELLNQGKPWKDYFVKITDLYDHDRNASGTRVEITFPLEH
jgi:LytS/YehU family sensor histidine kinase